MGDLSTRASAVTPAVQPCVKLGSVVQALRDNSTNTLLAVRNGSDWAFVLDRFLRSAHSFFQDWEPEHGPPDAMNQVMLVVDNIEEQCCKVVFLDVWDGLRSQVSIALFEAMRTNKTVRCLRLLLNDSTLTQRHLKAIEDSLLENDTLQTLIVHTSYGMLIACSHATVTAAFERILKRNMCLVRIDLRCVLAGHYQMDLGPAVKKAIERNHGAWIIAKQLGRVSRTGMHGCQHLGDLLFRRDLLLFFMEKGCQPPPQMLHILKGLPNR